MVTDAMRTAFGRTASALLDEDPRAAVVLAEISVSQYLGPAMRRHPDRAVNVGIMEQAMVGVAAGFALEGFRPIVHTIAPFLAERALEQVKLDFGYQRLEGLFISTGASYDYGTSGMTHHSPGDVAALSTVPRMEILVPGARGEAATLVRATHANGRPTYLRTTAVENSASHELEPAGLTLVRRGGSLTAIAVGPMLDRTLAALDGLDATVLYATTVFPLDLATLAAEAAPAAEVVVVEPFYAGTLAAEVTTALAHRPTRLLSIGVPRRAIHAYGTTAEHDRALGLDVDGIRERVLGFLRRFPAVSSEPMGASNTTFFRGRPTREERVAGPGR
jgi:transketolase